MILTNLTPTVTVTVTVEKEKETSREKAKNPETLPSIPMNTHSSTVFLQSPPPPSVINISPLIFNTTQR